MSCPYYLVPTKRATINLRERRSSHRVITTTVIATVLAGMALAVQAPVAGAATSFPTLVPDVAIVPFAGDVFTVGTNGSLIDVDHRNTPDSAPLFNLEEPRSPKTEPR